MQGPKHQDFPYEFYSPLLIQGSTLFCKIFMFLTISCDFVPVIIKVGIHVQSRYQQCRPAFLLQVPEKNGCNNQNNNPEAGYNYLFSINKPMQNLQHKLDNSSWAMHFHRELNILISSLCYCLYIFLNFKFLQFDLSLFGLFSKTIFLFFIYVFCLCLLKCL